MNKKFANITKNLAIFICVMILVSSTLFGISYAYFVSGPYTTSQQISTSITEEGVVAEVSTFEELYKATANSIFNDGNKTTSSRKIIRLTGDITLLNDLVITEDVHIDLGSHILTLGSHTISVIHSYAGSFMIYNGQIKVGDSGRIVINTTNAECLTENLQFLNMDGTAISDSTPYISIVAIDDKYTAYNAFYTISSTFIADLYKRPTFLTHDEFDALSVTDFTDTLFLPSTGCYINKDIDILTHYLSTDINVEYTSSDPTVLTTLGAVKKTGDVTLTVTLSSTAFTSSYTCDFALHVVETSSLDAGEAMIKSYLSDLYKDETLKVNDTITHNGYYFFNTGRDLPLKSKDFTGITYSYKTYADFACTTEVKNLSSEDKENILTFEPNENCYFLQITVKNSQSTKTVVLNMYTIYVAKKETAARLVLNELYGGSIIFNSSLGATHLYTYDEVMTTASDRVKAVANQYGLTAVSYDFKADSDAATDYKIENNELDITVDTPKKMKEEAVSVTFTFSDGTVTTIDLYVAYITSSSDTTNNFLPYYTLYDGEVSEAPSLDTFTMPFSYQNKAPYTIYDFSYTGHFTKVTDPDTSTITYQDLTIAKPASLQVKLCESDGTVIKDFTSSYQDGTSITSAFDAYMTTTFSAFTASHPDAYWEFSFDSSKIDAEDIETIIMYNYKFGDSSSSTWTCYQKMQENEDGSTSRVNTDLTASVFTINGGLVYSTDTSLENSVRNSTLFVYLYNQLHQKVATDHTDITTPGDNVILNDWFSFSIDIDTTTQSLTGDIDINGIQYLTACTSLNLSGITMNTTKIGLISGLSNIETLDISNASISDPTMLDPLKDMHNLKTLYINGNTLTTFDFLVDFNNLSEVYLYENTVSDTLSPYYGSTGMCNYQAYQDLIRKGVTVYYTINTSSVPMTYENNTDLNDYQRLRSIEYQATLKTGVSITVLYEKFVDLTSTDFKFENFGTPTWSYETGTLEDGTAITEGTATYFQATATTTVSSTTITLVVKFYVDRY